jgi:hypothetical protein
MAEAVLTATFIVTTTGENVLYSGCKKHIDIKVY